MPPGEPADHFVVFDHQLSHFGPADLLAQRLRRRVDRLGVGPAQPVVSMVASSQRSGLQVRMKRGLEWHSGLPYVAAGCRWLGCPRSASDRVAHSVSAQRHTLPGLADLRQSAVGTAIPTDAGDGSVDCGMVPCYAIGAAVRWARTEGVVPMNRESPATVLHLRPPTATRSERLATGEFPGVALDAYHLLARQGELSLGQIAAELRLAQEQVQAVVAELESLKLIRETDRGGVIAMPHSQAIDDLLAEQALLLAHAVESVSEGQRRLRTVVSNRTLLDPGEALRISSTAIGGSAQRGMFELPAEATEAISAMHPGGAFGDDLLERSIARAEENLGRNVRMRVVHQASVLRHPAMVSYLTELAALGCRVRLRDNLPFRMLLIDGASAVCAVPTSGSYLLNGERVMVLLNRVFETTWVDAQPLERVLSPTGCPTGTPAVAAGPAGASMGLSPAHEAILRLLAEGHTDRSIARSLGVTSRTVTRRIAEIYEVLGVDGRFQAGIAAKEFGIV